MKSLRNAYEICRYFPFSLLFFPFRWAWECVWIQRDTQGYTGIHRDTQGYTGGVFLFGGLIVCKTLCNRNNCFDERKQSNRGTDHALCKEIQRTKRIFEKWQAAQGRAAHSSTQAASRHTRQQGQQAQGQYTAQQAAQHTAGQQRSGAAGGSIAEGPAGGTGQYICIYYLLCLPYRTNGRRRWKSMGRYGRPYGRED